MAKFRDVLLPESSPNLGAFPTGSASRFQSWCGLTCALLLSVAILQHFHDRFWYPPDDGAYAHVADRMLQGQVLNRDVQDVHLGYINFANAAALQLFGRQLLSLRYPLVLMGVGQALVVYWLVSRVGIFAGICASVAVTCLSTIQFLNPTAHWYCLFLVILTVACLDLVPRDRWYRIVGIGLLLGLITCFRQLTGVLAAIGVISYLLAEPPRDEPVAKAWLARLLCAVMAAGLSWYLYRSLDWLGLAVFGLPPLALLAWVAVTTPRSNRQVLRMLGLLALGGLFAAAPLVGYHLAHGSISDWFHDTVLVANRLPRLQFFTRPSYLELGRRSVLQFALFSSFQSVGNAIFWVVVCAAGPVLGLLVLIRLTLGSNRTTFASSIPFVAAFYALVSIHYQIPIYLFYSAGLSWVGIICLLMSPGGRWRPYGRGVVALLTVLLVAVGLVFQAAQPVSRGWNGIVQGERRDLVPAEGLPSSRVGVGIPAAGLLVEMPDLILYSRLLKLIEQETIPSDAILALPVNPELYFLSGRRNPVRFYNAALGITTASEYDTVLHSLRQSRPKLIFHKSRDKYNTDYVERLLKDLSGDYERGANVSEFQTYRLKTAYPSDAQ